jgi:heat-inducible transcriptional repressor
VRHELDEAMRVTTETLAQVNDLLAVVSAPPVDTATVRHVEVLLLQPQVLMVVIITSTGGVSKRMFTFDRPVDVGLVDWAGSYLNERLVGMGLGARMLHQRLASPDLDRTEAAFIQSLTPAFTDLADSREDTLYVEGTARLLRSDRAQDASQLNGLIQMLEERVAVLGLLRSALDQNRVVVRIGSEIGTPALRSMSLVAAAYGLPQRNLGAVSLIGPLRMDYETAIGSVRYAADQLSQFVTDVYEERW